MANGFLNFKKINFNWMLCIEDLKIERINEISHGLKFQVSTSPSNQLSNYIYVHCSHTQRRKKCKKNKIRHRMECLPYNYISCISLYLRIYFVLLISCTMAMTWTQFISCGHLVYFKTLFFFILDINWITCILVQTTIDRCICTKPCALDQ